MQRNIFFILFLVTGCQENLPDRMVIDQTPSSNVATPNRVPAEDSTITVPKLHPRCQSNIRCVYTRMPIYSQGSSMLESYVGRMIGVSQYQDRGMCAPTSGAMVLSAVLSEKNDFTRLNNSFLDSIPGRPWYETIYEIGLDSGTDFRNGGTFLSDLTDALFSYFSQTQAKKGIYLSSWSRYTLWTNEEMLGLIKSKKPAFVISTYGLVNENGAYRFSGSSHALAIKGFDGDRLHIQDPWGMDHFARIQKEKVLLSRGVEEEMTTFKDFGTNPATFMGSYGTRQKIVLDGVTAISLD